MLIGLLIPVLVTLAALASILLPMALLVLLPNRRPRFMALLVSQNIEGTASALIVPAVGMAAWLIALRPWRTEPDAPPLSARIS